MNSIRIIRTGKNLTQKQVAQATGVSESVYSRYENGERNPSIRVLKALAVILGCSIDDLLRDPEEEEAAAAA